LGTGKEHPVLTEEETEWAPKLDDVMVKTKISMLLPRSGAGIARWYSIGLQAG
jgi:hypothetical protein